MRSAPYVIVSSTLPTIAFHVLHAGPASINSIQLVFTSGSQPLTNQLAHCANLPSDPVHKDEILKLFGSKDSNLYLIVYFFVGTNSEEMKANSEQKNFCNWTSSISCSLGLIIEMMLVRSDRGIMSICSGRLSYICNEKW